MKILAEGDGWLVVAKPPRLIVYRSRDTRDEDAALQLVRDMVGKRVYPIHRLDRQASGCLLFATEREIAGDLHSRLGQGQKTYLALVRGVMKERGPLIVDTPLKTALPGGESGTKDARTEVERLASCPEPRASLLRCKPETGRFHQVRRHVRDLNHPIIGDVDHGDSRVNRWWREERGMGRLALHAARLELDGVVAECPLFEDMAAVLRALPLWEEALEREPLLAQPPLSIGQS